MSKTLLRILRTRARYFAEFAEALRERLQDRGIEPEDSALIEVAVQLYAIEEDESEIYLDEDGEDPLDDEEDL